jgi:hypothetical protein
VFLQPLDALAAVLRNLMVGPGPTERRPAQAVSFKDPAEVVMLQSLLRPLPHDEFT